MKRIADIPLTNAQYQLWSFILDNEAQAGAKFSKHDVQALIRASRQPMNSHRQAELQSFNKAMDKFYRLNEQRNAHF